MSIAPQEAYPKLYNPELIKPDLAFDGENYKLSKRELSKIRATHGSTIEAAASLLLTGKFQRSNALSGPNLLSGAKHKFDDQFYTTPNPRHGLDIDAFGSDFDTDLYAEVDAIQAGIEYAECGKDTANGVVIAFAGKLSLEGAQIHTDPLFTTHAEASNGIELVLPQAPTIEAVAGIYPVDEQASQDLTQYLQRVL